jgi:hypothetical protein
MAAVQPLHQVVPTNDAPRTSLLRPQAPGTDLVVDQVATYAEGHRRFLDGVCKALNGKAELG